MDIETIKKHIDDVLIETDFPELGEKKRGKVRDVYDQKDKLVLIATDRYSAFDRNLALIPFKGEILTQITKFYLQKNLKMHDIGHVFMISPKGKMFVDPPKFENLEVVANLPQLKERIKEKLGLYLEGMKKNQKFDKPVITPTTKFEAHDRPLSGKIILEEKILPPEIWKKACEITLKLFARGQEIALQRGLILVDTKYEFGLDENGNIMLIDEIHTPDSSPVKAWNLRISTKNSCVCGSGKIATLITMKNCRKPRRTWWRSFPEDTYRFTSKSPAKVSSTIFRCR
ncbi:MAG: Phosphoribosylaminoimidazole-succinocarboxamide synthase [Candidatus Nomurabacteria bacterium GW2011_GWF2_43_8]|uniref:phosphoribosylaminoimidazolesuccinocarboxamide synthase n=1 Tax=Candidatus Nomurabacteria bacterium GW2011_GWF2_43_8 TaxID=1618779 RepID=A0A0G1IHF6_9BACT|nr:MAG: Phosphoribosylaminoimidazole-succinocarboxamide synthase [Candidatus Nomurabacteria bacterium GW2011_GWF2_43_8]